MSMNEKIERLLLIAYSEAVSNTRYTIYDSGQTPMQEAREWLDTAKWDGTLDREDEDT